LAATEELVILVVAAVAAGDLGEVGDELEPASHLTCLKPSWISLRRRSGAPCPSESGSPFMS
jgi:hypothetical protein